MADQDRTNNKAATTIGYSGIILTLLANAITSIEFEKFNDTTVNYLICLFCAAIFFILMSIALDFTITHYVTPKEPKYDTEKILEKSYNFFLLGLVLSTSIIISIMFESTTYGIPNGFIITIIFLFLIICLTQIIKYTTKIKLETSQQPSETEEPLIHYNKGDSKIRIK